MARFDPQGYDLIVEKVKTGSRDVDVEYHVIPEPPSELDEGITELAKHVPVNLDALYEGNDPFGQEEGEETGDGDGRRHGRSATRSAQAS